MLSALSKILPPPSLLTMSCSGVDISDNSVKYITFQPRKKSNGARLIKNWGEISIPNGAIQRGIIKEPEKLASVLTEFKQKTGAELVSISLPEERVYLFETEIKKDVPEKEAIGLLEFRIEENVPIPSREVAFDYALLPNQTDSTQQEIVVAAYAEKTISDYYQVCDMAGLFPVAFEVEAQAMVRSVVPDDLSGAVMVVDFGKNRTGIGIARQGVLLYTSTIEFGGEYLSQCLRRELGENISETEITNLKNKIGLLKSADSPKISQCLMEELEPIKEEIKTRMQYWHLRNNSNEDRMVKSIILCGGTTNVRGLPEYFSRTFGLPCVRANVWQRVFSLEENIPPIERPFSYGFATAIGLALGNTA